MKTIFVHANLLDTELETVRSDAWVRVDENLITEVGDGAFNTGDDERVIDCQGGTLMPGLIDAHAHMGIIDVPLEIERMPRAVFAARVFAEMRDTLESGFTTIRDAGFTDASFKYAVEAGLAVGPRMLVSNGALSVTGGHADNRHREDHRAQRPTDGLYWPGLIADGVAEVRKAAREVLRCGADQIKIMAAGGTVGSLQDDPLDDQFSGEEIAAAVYEAACRRTYVLAHCNSASSILNCARNGVRSIEHGNFLNEEAATYMAQNGVALVPTIMNYRRLGTQMRDRLHPTEAAKVDRVVTASSEALKIAHEHGVRIGMGSDAISKNQPFKAVELEVQAEVQGAMGAIVSATSVNAEILRLADKIGQIAPGFEADMLLVDGDPLEDISVLQDRKKLSIVMKGGQVVADRRA
jgi:imidazolonepropionase-like amidohydrolase